MKCALFGFGYWGKIIKKYLDKSDIFSIKYIYYPSMENEVNIQAILDDKEIECIFICTPIDTHYELTKKAILAGKHVFCEKPLCKYTNEVNELIKISLNNNVCLYTDYIYTNSHSINHIKDKIKEIGKINYIKAEIKQFGNFYKNDDVYAVIGVHMIASILYILSQNEDIVFDITESIIIRKDKSNILHSILKFIINKEICGSIECSLTTNRKCRNIEFIGEYGSFYFDMMSQNTVEEILLEKENTGFSIKEENYFTYDESNNLNLAIDDFYNAINNDRFSNLKLALRVTQIIERINLL